MRLRIHNDIVLGCTILTALGLSRIVQNSHRAKIIDDSCWYHRPVSRCRE